MFHNMDMKRIAEPAAEEAGPATAGAQTLRRATAVLRVLAATLERGARVTDVAEQCGLTRPTAHRLLQVLVEEGLAERLTGSTRYVIGREATLFGIARPSAFSLRSLAEPVLEHVAQETGDGVALTVRSGPDSICVARRAGSFPSRTAAAVIGARLPLGVGVGGLAILAFLPDWEIDEVLRTNAVRLARRRLTELHLRERLPAVRAKGHAFTEAGVTPGTHVVAVPVFDANRRPIAALSVNATATRLPARRAQQLLPLLAAQAQALGRQHDLLSRRAGVELRKAGERGA